MGKGVNGEDDPSFNPRPPISWRATQHAPVSTSSRDRFNPRPPISWRATDLLRHTDRHTADVSIHAHQFHGGRRDQQGHVRRSSRCFNPRPPISWRATNLHRVCIASFEMFQSTPTNFMAGDGARWRAGSAMSSFNPRPPISWRATLAACRGTSARASFNPRPPISWRATLHPLAIPAQFRQFQSTPTNFMAGDARVSVVMMTATKVSIHAHQFHGGRQPLQRPAPVVRGFQSTPTNFMAGDRVRAPAGAA